MKFSIDRIENEVVVVENIETKEIKEIHKNLLPSSIHEGTILVFVDNYYIIEEAEEEKRLTSIKEKFNRLKKG